MTAKPRRRRPALIRFYVTAEEKLMVAAAAARQRVTLSRWAREILMRAAREARP